MKKFFVIIGIILILLLVGILIFAVTFDANRYKGVLITKLEQAINKDVKIDNLSLNFLYGIGIKTIGVSIKDRDKAWDEALLKAKSLDISVKIIPLLKNDIQVQRLFIPELMITQVKPVIKDIDVKAGFSNNSLVIQKLTGSIAGGRFSVKGIIRDIVNNPDTELDIKLNNINISDFMPDMPTGSPEFKGLLNIEMQGSVKGLAQDAILTSIKAKGKANLGSSVLENMNVLKVALDKLSMLPGLVQRLKDNLPERYKPLLKKNSTEFKPMNTDFNIKEGRIFFDKLLVESDAFHLTSRGSIGMDQDLQVSANLFIPSDLSEACINVVPELKFLADSKGAITMPVEVRGKIPNISVMPNLDYVIQRLAVSKGQELLGRLFKKQTSGQTDQEKQDTQKDMQNQGSEGSSTEKPAETILKGVLDIFTKPSQPESE